MVNSEIPSFYVVKELPNTNHSFPYKRISNWNREDSSNGHSNLIAFNSINSDLTWFSKQDPFLYNRFYNMTASPYCFVEIDRLSKRLLSNKCLRSKDVMQLQALNSASFIYNRTAQTRKSGFHGEWNKPTVFPFCKNGTALSWLIWWLKYSQYHHITTIL